MIGVLIFPNFQLLDAAGPISVFEAAGELSGRRIDTKLIALGNTPIRSSSGVKFYAADARRVRSLDTLIVAGSEDIAGLMGSERTIAFVRSMAAKIRRIAGIGSGAHVLGRAGLLNGRRATTHWSLCKDLRALGSGVRLQPSQLIVKDGKVWSCAGNSAGVDLALAMVAEDYGSEIAKEVARDFVLCWPRSGGQSQFSAGLQLKSSQNRFGAFLKWVHDHLDEPLTLDRMSAQFHLSPRQFTRTFAAATGISPSKAVESLRISTARAKIETMTDSMEAIAHQTGFRDAAHMRRAFIRIFGQPPQSFRRTARRS
ncbi:GlxA family transcriptional regulator [Bradyrhizobium cytisi]|uniref:Helix-turn-helix domain-containing protein n=1 Tax=Bradyrhizobium cytisi TaxID=515489 RepID=A0A5S4WW31_9BRAD|nr:helix-turn-helix domain-containing protein [Bradyrhizobium cytisi]TYL85823.1 helix-turn-helix domain-containing protein [Bradyrhizobium cytisi]